MNSSQQNGFGLVAAKPTVSDDSEDDVSALLAGQEESKSSESEPKRKLQNPEASKTSLAAAVVKAYPIKNEANSAPLKQEEEDSDDLF